VATYTYDALDRLIKTTLPNGDISTITYDVVGNVVAQINGANETTRFTFDLLGRLLSTTLPNGAATTYTYNAVGQVISVTDANHNVTASTYDALGRLVLQVDPLGAARTFVYDLANQLTSMVDRDGRKTTFTYDVRGLRTTEVWRDGAGLPVETIAYLYDAVGELLSLTTRDTVITYTYDSRGLALSESNVGTVGSPAVIFTYTYDALGRMITSRETINGQPGATETYAYDAAGRETSVAQSGTGVAAISVSWSFDAAGRPISETRIAGGATAVSSTRIYDANGRLIQLAYTGSAAALAAYTLEFDAAGRISKLTQSGHTTAYVYDAAGQLVTVQHNDPAIPDETYTYDAAGNRIDSTANGVSVLGAGNRLLSDAAFIYTYDAAGNLLVRTDKVTGVHRNFTWDYRNRLVRVDDYAADGSLAAEVTYAYDGTDRRISTLDNAAPGSGLPIRGRYFVYSGAELILEFVDFDVSGGAAPQLAVRYFYGPAIDQVLAQEVVDTGVQWLLANHEGSISDMANAAGVAIQHFDYDAYGNIVQKTAVDVDTRFRFTGREFDFETGLYYYRARYLDPHTGRFLSEDPSGFASGDTNLYRYSGNDPVNRVDPSGRTSYVPATTSSAQYQAALRQYGLKPTQLDRTRVALEEVG
jgi:RHS repeat-associated protein